ncbi:MAG TPA: hypothetical protein VNZ64_26645 [Candidatus Acidoferrum sp.]|jgi:hypothetical protein|nr:hypothetical protein [Candidatus Acidoferrum sp.]
MRTLLAMLFAVALVLEQSVSVGTAGLATAQSGCRPCVCASRKCCVSKSSPTPAPAPATPVRSLSLKQHQSMLPPNSVVCALMVSLAPRLSSVFFSVLSAEAVPLYQRDCAFLL